MVDFNKGMTASPKTDSIKEVLMFYHLKTRRCVSSECILHSYSRTFNCVSRKSHEQGFMTKKHIVKHTHLNFNITLESKETRVKILAQVEWSHK